MQPGHHSSPRSWRAALVVACIAATTVVCAILASEVHQADAALEATSSQTLRNYATAAGRVLGTEAIRRSTEFRSKLFGPLMGTVIVDGQAPLLHTFAQRADSLFAAEKYEPDQYRGYLRIDVRTRKWDGLLAMADSSRASVVVDTVLARARVDVPQGPMLVLPGVREPIVFSAGAVADAAGHQYMYVITQARATNFRHAMRATMETVPLLPPSFAGTAWKIDAQGVAANKPANDSLIGVTIVAVDGTVLYTSPNRYGGPYRGSYQFQSGRGGFTIETVLRPSLATQLVPAVVRSAGRSLYIGFGLVGCLLLAVSLVAFWGEMTHQTEAQARSMQQLTTGLRHELNNALASVMLESQMLAASDDAGTDARYAGAAIAEQAERMRKVLRRLDDVDRLPVVNYIEGKSMVDLAEVRPGADDPRRTARAG
ncbi:MAG: histidine kinase dimerization/phospho-acceptor domain-containing protein [Gemmatimonadaceae bacterium]